eukprot:scaffold3073_cov66-Cylindrotheca_fusiformis.AAC.19
MMPSSVITQYIDQLSSTQLYTAIVAFTVGLCVILLGPAGDQNLPLMLSPRNGNNGNGNNADNAAAMASENEEKQTTNKQKLNQQQQEPKWYLFKYINVDILGQVVPTRNNSNSSSSSSSNTNNEQEQEKEESKKTLKSVSPPPSPLKKKNKVVLHPPAASAPVCSDPASFSTTTTTTTTTTLNNKKESISEMNNEDIAQLVLQNQIKDHELEKRLDPFRAVTVRRMVASAKLDSSTVLQNLPQGPSLDYSKVYGANCEIVIGYVPLPVGLVGPLTLNGESVYIPMATTEGCLVASTQRGAKAISQGLVGAQAQIVKDGITRAPCLIMGSAMEAANVKECTATIAGKNVYLRLVCFAGDAMGMNMVSKGSLKVIETLKEEFPTLKLVALSGNMCTDKKAAATNWLYGRGKSVVVEAIIPKQVVSTTLKTTVPALVQTNLNKNLIGSAMAGAMGGFNAHASNIVTAIFLATGQDPAQNVESSNCITLMEETIDGDLWISCTMPSIEVGTVGGGTSLPAQGACLEMIGCKGGSKHEPGKNAQKLALVVAAATMAGELSLLSALAANTLVQAHMTHNRKPTNTTTK